VTRVRKDPPEEKETNDRWLTQYGDFKFKAGPNCTAEEAKAMNDKMEELRRTKPRITENHDGRRSHRRPGNLDRSGWGAGEFRLDSSPVHSAEEIRRSTMSSAPLGLQP
jgi:hypothetical protein